jgi:hypothetical protein
LVETEERGGVMDRVIEVVLHFPASPELLDPVDREAEKGGALVVARRDEDAIGRNDERCRRVHIIVGWPGMAPENAAARRVEGEEVSAGEEECLRNATDVGANGRGIGRPVVDGSPECSAGRGIESQNGAAIAPSVHHVDAAVGHEWRRGDPFRGSAKAVLRGERASPDHRPRLGVEREDVALGAHRENEGPVDGWSHSRAETAIEIAR